MRPRTVLNLFLVIILAGLSAAFGAWLGEVDLQTGKREGKTEAQHPVYSPLYEQWEGFMQHLTSFARDTGGVSLPMRLPAGTPASS